MSTNNRRAIAGELRRKANDSLDGESLQRALARIAGAEDSSWRGVMRCLADLIEPPLSSSFICEASTIRMLELREHGGRYGSLWLQIPVLPPLWREYHLRPSPGRSH